MNRPRQVTKPELEALHLAARGLSSKESGKVLNISNQTVKDRLQRACWRLDARNTVNAVAIALSRGLIQLDQGAS